MRHHLQHPAASFVTVSLLIGASASAQEHTVLWSNSEAAANAGYGRSVVSIGDIDGDGSDDVAVAAPFLATAAGSGVIRLLSGSNGALISQITPPGTDAFGFGDRLAVAGDVDGDGAIDLITQSSPSSPGHDIWILRLDGSLIRKHSGNFDFGRQVAGGYDVNGDGRDDYAIGNSAGPLLEVFVGSIEIHSGASGAQLWKTGFGDQNVGNTVDNWPVLLTGDLNGDGKSEFAMGFTGAITGVIGAGMVRVWSGATGTQLKQFSGLLAGSDFGGSLADLGDVNLDGTNDFGIGQTNGSLSAVGTIVSGKSLSVLFTIPKTNAVVGPAGDADHDGFPDVVVTPVSGSSSFPAIHSGKDQKVLYTFTNGVFGSKWGFDRLGDVDGDGYADLAVGQPIGPGGGLVKAYSGCPSSVIPIVTACAGSGGFTPSLTENGCFDANSLVSLSLSNALGGAAAMLFVGTTAPGGGTVSQGCFFQCGAPAIPLFATILSGSGAGQGAWSATFPVHALTPTAIRTQFVIADPAKASGLVVSNSLTITISTY